MVNLRETRPDDRRPPAADGAGPSIDEGALDDVVDTIRAGVAQPIVGAATSVAGGSPANLELLDVGVDVDIDVDAGGGRVMWPGTFMVDELAIGCVSEVTRLVSAVAAERGIDTGSASVDARNAATGFKSEALVRALGWEIPPVWDPIAGDYEAADGWVRLHTNYPHHRSAVLAAMACREDSERGDVARTVARLDADEVERRVVSAGGPAAACRTREEWASGAPGRSSAAAPLLAATGVNGATDRDTLRPDVEMPLAGVRVLDLTRVLAGPTATAVLAAWGAEVVRIDPPLFPEVGALVPVTTAGKRCLSLDLRAAADRAVLDELLVGADVVVHGYRPGALAGLGLDLSSPQPGQVRVTLNAYGWEGEWNGRRGFDSLVQHSVGITSAAANRPGGPGSPRWTPTPLPCQALDHGAGWLMAAAALAGLLIRHRHGVGTTWRTSLVSVSELLWRLPRRVDAPSQAPTLAELDDLAATVPTAWGELRRLRLPGTVGEMTPVIGASGPVGAMPANRQNGRWAA